MIQYHLNHPRAKITIPSFGQFVRDQGHDVADYLIRRHPEIRNKIDEINDENTATAELEVAVYHPLDVNHFVESNFAKDKLVAALTKREEYYASVAISASRMIESKSKMKQELEAVTRENQELKEALSIQREKMTIATDSKKDKIIKRLIQIIDVYVTPSIATTLLQKEGLMEVAETVLRATVVDDTVLSPDDNIIEASNDLTSKLMAAFEM